MRPNPIIHKSGRSLSGAIEKMWVFWTNSDRWRRFAKRGVWARFSRSRAFQKAALVRRFAITYYQSRLDPQFFQEVNTFCMFIGHAKSGGTMIGSLLDAHANMIIADETDVFGYVSSGFSRDQIYHLLLKGSRRDALKGRVTARRVKPYSFAVAGQWQSRYQKLRVIGHSKAGPSTGKLSRSPILLEELREVMAGVNVKIIQVIRNPYDPISYMMIRGKRSFTNAIDHYFNYCNTLTTLREQLDESNLLAVKYDVFVRNPQEQLGAICQFLGLEAEVEYLDACASILYASPERNRNMVAGDEKSIDIVQNKIDQVEFLAGYTFEN